MIPLAIIGCTFASLWFFALLWFSDRRHIRTMADRHADRHERQMEREDKQFLLQRIQAPQEAVTQHIIQTQPKEPTEPPQRDFDAAWDMIGIDPIGAE